MKAEKLAKVKKAVDVEKVKMPVMSIQDRMKEQVTGLCATWDDCVDQLCFW